MCDAALQLFLLFKHYFSCLAAMFSFDCGHRWVIGKNRCRCG